MRIWSRPLGDFGTNCYIVACTETGAAMVIDPGAPDPWIVQTLEDSGAQLAQIVLTHGHLDHIGGVEWLRNKYGVPVAVHTFDAPLLTDPALNGSLYFGMPVAAGPAEQLLLDGDIVNVGTLQFRVIHTPGHTRGGICLYMEGGGGRPGQLFSGDTLFAGSIGRTDLPGGDQKTLLTSIRERLMVLPPETVVHPGHDTNTSIGDEAEYNPFL